jgi:hypothetical protein
MRASEFASSSTIAHAGRIAARGPEHRPMPAATPRIQAGPTTVERPLRQPPRLQLKPEAPSTGHVDGAWWPHSRDLVAELSALLEALAVRLGRVEGVSYHLADWGVTARKTAVDGAFVRVAGYRTQPADTVDVIGVAGRVTLLVVPPEADSATAGRAMTAAARVGNTDDIPTLLNTLDGGHA